MNPKALFASFIMAIFTVLLVFGARGVEAGDDDPKVLQRHRPCSTIFNCGFSKNADPPVETDKKKEMKQ